MKNIENNNWHFARPELAQSYLTLFELGLTSARGLFARRRMGKTEFLKKDLIPAAKNKKYVTVYVNLWDLETDPDTAIIAEFYKSIEPKGFNKIWSKLKLPIDKIKATGKVPFVGESSLEVNLNDNRIAGTLLMEAMNTFDKLNIKLLLVIDEAQVLANAENSYFAQALRAALDVRKERIKVIFAGSSETTLRRMFGVSSEPFYNWAPLEPFELLGDEFVKFIVMQVNHISKFKLSLSDALQAFAELKSTPEFFRRYIEHYIINPFNGSFAALDAIKKQVYNDENFKQQWDSLLAADRVILNMIANGVSDLHGKLVLQRLGAELGIGDAIDKNITHNALRRLSNKNIITKIKFGVYQFEDEAFADWVKHGGVI